MKNPLRIEKKNHCACVKVKFNFLHLTIIFCYATGEWAC